MLGSLASSQWGRGEFWAAGLLSLKKVHAHSRNRTQSAVQVETRPHDSRILPFDLLNLVPRRIANFLEAIQRHVEREQKKKEEEKGREEKEQ